MEKKRFERELPSGYTLARHINCKKTKFAILMNVFCIVIMAAITLAMYFAAVEKFTGESLGLFMGVGCGLALIPIFIYTALHELVHGWAYKRMTGEKLTFGLTWSCAFCGVPGIYVYRAVSIFALMAPFVVFGVIFGGLALVAIFVAKATGSVAVLFLYAMLSVLLGAHVGGCVGDLYVFGLLIFKYRGKKTLIRDTGPEQFIYVLDDTVLEEQL